MCMDLMNLHEQISILNIKADAFHVDIMDGHFVKNIVLSPLFIGQIKQFVNIPIDAHLMVENPNDFIETCINSGAGIITLHAETINNEVFRLIDILKNHEIKVGVALNPATPVNEIKHYINRVDKITIMTVDPGFSGQKFIPETVEKIREVKNIKNKYNYEFLIEADGSCNIETFQTLKEAGCEMFVLGSSGLFGIDNNLENAWKKMEQNFSKI